MGGPADASYARTAGRPASGSRASSTGSMWSWRCGWRRRAATSPEAGLDAWRRREIRLPGLLDTAPIGDLDPEGSQGVLQPIEDRQHRAQLSIVAHRPDAPDPAAQRTKRGGDLNAKLAEQPHPARLVRNTLGKQDRGDHRKTVVGVPEQLEPHSRQPCL